MELVKTIAPTAVDCTECVYYPFIMQGNALNPQGPVIV